MNCSAKIQPTDDNCSPEPNITNSPKVKNPKAKKAVPIYPILKSSNDSFKDTLTLVSFFFATVHNECHTETSRGAGVQQSWSKNIKKLFEFHFFILINLENILTKTRKTSIAISFP